MVKENNQIPQSVIRRLTRYLSQIHMFRDSGEEWVSSQVLAEALDLTSSTVRQDLSHIDISGISRKGYEVKQLEKSLKKVLGADLVWNAVVVGAGNLGRALAAHEDFSRKGFRICGIVDKDKSKIGKRVGRLRVQPLRRLPIMVGDENIAIGILAVPEAAAQSVADILIASGVRGILNMALSHVIVPARVSVVDARMVASLQELSYAIMTNR
ncbi:MAG: redox-sensing transcriptional repressor Rex [Verrucomicrobiota bacterium]